MNTGGAEGGRRDFFISHAGHDRAWAEWVAWHLSDAGYNVELDCWDWGPGDNFVLKMSKALDSADRVVALLSPEYFEPSRYTADEWSAALIKDEAGQHRLLPLRIAPCDVPHLLRPLVSSDLFGMAEDEALQRLLAAARGPVRPGGRPLFPPSGADRGRRAPTGSAPRLPGSLPQIWNVQQRNPAFVGRDTALVELRDQLLAGRTAVTQALHGMGGVGKTQLAVEYAYRFSGAYELVWWITAERTELIATQLADLAVETGAAEDTAEIQAAVSALYSDLRRRGGWLLIFDNAEDPRALQQWLPGGPGHVLITSRNPNWGEIAAPVNVAVFALEESVTLLRRRVPGISAADAEDVAAELGNLPLALAQAAGVLGETGVPAAAYLEHLTGHASEALAEGTPASYSRSLAATVTDAAARLADAEPAAAALLQLSAFFGPEPIPASFFTAAVQLPSTLADIAADPMRLYRALGRISSYGLARLDQAGLQVHRLVQAIVRDRLSAGQRRDDSACVAALLVAAGPADTDNPAVWPAWASLLPHLLAANPAESDNADLRRLAARALLYLLRRGDSVTAENLGTALHRQWAERLGPDHADTLAAATELAFAYRDRGHLAETRALVEDTLARRRRVLGEDHPDTLRSASDLAVTLSDLGELRPARELAEDTLAKRRQILGDDHPDTLRTASSLSNDLGWLGEYQAARELAEDTLARQRQILGNDHPDTLRTASNLSNVLSGLGKYQAARELAEDTLARQRQILGDHHPDTLHTASKLSNVLSWLGEYQAARELAEDTLARQRRIFGEDHPYTLNSAVNLASVLFSSGNLFAARQLLKPTLTACRKTLGVDHPLTRRVAEELYSIAVQFGGHPARGKPKARKKRKKRKK
jgi:TIR domain/Tetratricopeptide repeat/NB-ARC domain